MRIFIIAITNIFIFAHCTKKDDCPPNQNTKIEIKATLRDYLPYKASQQVKFMRYIDSVYSDLVIFDIDTETFVEDVLFQSGDCNAGSGQWAHYLNTEHLHYNLINHANQTKLIRIELIGGFAKDLYGPNTDNSKLKISFYDSNFEFAIGKEIMVGSSNSELDSIVFNDKNYGPGFCIKRKKDFFSNDSISLFFNSTYGIIGFINQTTKEKFICTN